MCSHACYFIGFFSEHCRHTENVLPVNVFLNRQWHTYGFPCVLLNFNTQSRSNNLLFIKYQFSFKNNLRLGFNYLDMIMISRHHHILNMTMKLLMMQVGACCKMFHSMFKTKLLVNDLDVPVNVLFNLIVLVDKIWITHQLYAHHVVVRVYIRIYVYHIITDKVNEVFS